jgi:hypothetical protein
MPKITIDHIDTNRSNNAINNLREAYYSENAQNIKNYHPNNKYSKLLGAHYDKNKQKFYSVIVTKGKKKWLGWFDFSIDAHNAYLKAKKELHEFNTL